MKSEEFFPIIDAHSHLWLKQDTTWNNLKIKTSEGNSSRSFFLDQEVQMLPPFMIDGKNFWTILPSVSRPVSMRVWSVSTSTIST